MFIFSNLIIVAIDWIYRFGDARLSIVASIPFRVALEEVPAELFQKRGMT
jgi:hypothetical protein